MRVGVRRQHDLARAHLAGRCAHGIVSQKCNRRTLEQPETAAQFVHQLDRVDDPPTRYKCGPEMSGEFNSARVSSAFRNRP